jgi:AraC-like DNA-binding protein
MGNPEVMRFVPPPADLAPFVVGFGHRRDERGGDVVIVLPEARPTLQLMLADDYWLRERTPEAQWRRAPRVALWGPRLVSGYGYAARRIHAYGLALTPAGFRTIAGQAPAALLNQAVDLGGVAPELAAGLAAAASSSDFDDWVRAACAILRMRFGQAPAPPPISAALDVLSSHGSVAEAARRFGLSERQFRRVFAAEHGAPPKTYQRLQRFDRTLRALHPDPWERPTGDGASGYADQAHLIREFCAIAQITPGAYKRSKARHGDRILRSVVAEGVVPPPLAFPAHGAAL